MESFTFSRYSDLSGKRNTMVIPLSKKKFFECWMKWDAGMVIQKAFPMLSIDEREFIKTGVTPDEWNEMVGPDPEF